MLTKERMTCFLGPGKVTYIASMDSMAAALHRNFCKIASELLHTQIWARFWCGFGFGSIILPVFSNMAKRLS